MSKLPPDHAPPAGADGNSPVRDDTQQKLHQLLAGLWEQSRNTVAAHVETLQQARTLAENGQLDDAGRARAIDSAHKLAGVLGTFGLPRGTELARVAEEAFREPAGPGPQKAEALRPALDELHNLVQAAVTYQGS
jgi:HPt (histidine-containing phosphotransfer) domain-containing protein